MDMKKNNGPKAVSISGKVIQKMAIIMVIVNIFVMGSLAYWVNYLVKTGEEKYMTEVIQRLSTEMSQNINRYEDAISVFSESVVLKSFLQESERLATAAENGTSTEEFNPYAVGISSEGLIPVQQQEGYGLLIQEMSILADLFSDTLLYVAVGSLHLDRCIDHLGGYSQENYDLSQQDYYVAVTENRLFISEAYTDQHTGQHIVSIAHPIHDDNGRAIGVVIFDVLVDKISTLVTTSSFGDTGNTYILDKNNGILVYPSNVSTTNISFEGDDINREMSNPTGEIVHYTVNGTQRVGGMSSIQGTEWKVLSGMDLAEFTERGSFVVTMLTLMQIFCMLIIMASCAWDISKKLAPIKDIELFMGDVAEGSLHNTLEFRSYDEIGRLADNIQDTAKSLSTYVDHISGAMEQFGQGNFIFSHDVEYQGDFQGISQSMDQFVALMSGSLGRLQSAVHEVHSGAYQVSNAAQIVAKGSIEQAESVVLLNQRINEINDSIVGTAENSSKVSGDAQNISADLQTSNDKVINLVDSVMEIKDMSNEVKRIIKAIEEVAFQTNILALNAAVEAARAGESGKGFAVVADEVRNLSMKTSEAVLDTTKIINNMATVISSGTDLAQDASRDLQQVVNAVGRFVDSIGDISLSAQGQAEAIVEINQGIDRISDVVNQNSAVSQEAAAASEELSTQSTFMLDLIQKFNLQ